MITIADFLKIVKSGDLNAVKKAVDDGFPINAANKQGVNGFYAAIRASKMDIAEWFWNQGVSSVYADPWNKIACEKYLDYFIKFDGHKQTMSFDFPSRILNKEYRFVAWALKYSELSNGQKAANVANAISYSVGKYYLGNKVDPIELKMVKLCIENLKDPTVNENGIMHATWQVDSLLPKDVVDYIMGNQKMIEKAVELKQYQLLPKNITDVFIF